MNASTRTKDEWLRDLRKFEQDYITADIVDQVPAARDPVGARLLFPENFRVFRITPYIGTACSIDYRIE